MRSQPTDYPDVNQHKEEVLIVVKTYPRPSPKYRELVCTAGITRKGKWIRLYPISYRYMDFLRRYSKYQWISVDLEKNNNDFRIDSYRPIEKSIKTLGQPLLTNKDKKWSKRKEIILSTFKYKSLEEIEDDYKKYKVSLGIFKPKKIIDFKIEADDQNWSQKQQMTLSQMRLFEKQPKRLEKIPFKFSYVFSCNDNLCKTHKLSIIDWEIFELYRNVRKNYRYDIDVILEKVKQRWFNDMWDQNRDSYLIVGTQFPNPTFMVLGVFWPPK